MQHMLALKQVLRYLLGTKSYGITYSNVLNHLNHFYGYANAIFTKVDEHKSTTRYIFKIAGGAVTWYFKKQTITTLLSTEAEYIALLEAG